MRYFVYENWTKPHARVHKEACAEAQAFIKENNCEDKQYNCAHCHPELA